jgi:hypothetical protein
LELISINKASRDVISLEALFITRSWSFPDLKKRMRRLKLALIDKIFNFNISGAEATIHRAGLFTLLPKLATWAKAVS